MNVKPILNIDGLDIYEYVVYKLEKPFYDSYMMCQMMVAYMEVAPKTTLAFDLYGQLSGMSSNFRELAKKAKEENAQGMAYSGAAYGGASAVSGTQATAGNTTKPVFCGNCGAQNEQGTKFCGSCGSPMQ